MIVSSNRCVKFIDFLHTIQHLIYPFFHGRLLYLKIPGEIFNCIDTAAVAVIHRRIVPFPKLVRWHEQGGREPVGA